MQAKRVMLLFSLCVVGSAQPSRAYQVARPIPNYQTPKQIPGALEPGSGIVNPVVITRVDPQYSSEGLRAKTQGEVWIDCVIGTNGLVIPSSIKVSRSLDRINGMKVPSLKRTPNHSPCAGRSAIVAFVSGPRTVRKTFPFRRVTTMTQ